MLERLQDQTTSDNLYLQQSLIEYSDDVLDDDEYNETANPIMEKTLEEVGAEGIRVLTNFTPEEFEVIWEQAEIAMTSRWNEGRGRKSATSAKDAFFITLTVLKHYQSREKHAVDFGLKAPTLEKLVVRVVAVCSELLYDSFVVKPTMTSLRTKSKVFAHFPYALYATDHKLYRFKIEASVSPEVLLVDMSPHEPGSVSDLTMFRNRLDDHLQALSKTDNELAINDNGELP
ncbi:hypothetical protein H310_14746 [Aphanomyces invadans]|uniref:DDE Tnp4 domain-containing protein n=1 Tax=Aphanomyces invadans TaxID=157072 RepID=A0A024TA32_9STRA|nr:hypothetical protein H310_14746 [Aphanomyces invadans]ETV90466.1 hypothetical protein H310_14746 [Aphanomyces invadans]|eukprot:XP_008880894.1 hypothetical protein H310_14746 [Aphanomyces invadans]